MSWARKTSGGVKMRPWGSGPSPEARSRAKAQVEAEAQSSSKSKAKEVSRRITALKKAVADGKLAEDITKKDAEATIGMIDETIGHASIENIELMLVEAEVSLLSKAGEADLVHARGSAKEEFDLEHEIDEFLEEEYKDKLGYGTW